MDLLFNQIQDRFTASKNFTQAQGMKAYMRDRFEYLGLPAPVRNEIQKEFFPQIKPLSIAQKLELCTFLWNREEREYQYFAIEILKKYFKQPPPEVLHNIRYFITHKSWWDTVDLIASNTLGKLIATNPDLITVMDEWIRDENLWIRRSALLFQLKYKQNTDAARLFNYCIECVFEEDFFIRKAIGWALRQYSKENPEAVEQFVEQYKHQLSELSKKEALRLIEK